MRTSWAALAVSLSACHAGTDPNLVDVSGHWVFTERLEDLAHGYSCADTGRYEFVQQGDQFVGHYGQSGICNTPNGRVNNADSGTVESGRVVGRTIRFMVTASCQYEGSASGSPASALAGHGVCVLQDVSRTLNFTGQWQATR